jgi:endonuclease G
MITTADDKEIQYAQDNDGLNMAIPKYYFKAVAQMRGANFYTIAYRFDNATPTNRNIDAFEMTVSALEVETGFVFFPMIPKETKDIIVAERWR